jgi:hypothetical protein
MAWQKRRFVLCVLDPFDDPDQIEPDIHIFTRSKLPWIKLPDDKPEVEDLYEHEDLWPMESLARRNAVFEEE